MLNTLKIFIELIITAGIFNGFFFSLLLFKSQSKNKVANPFLMVFLICLSLTIAHTYYIDQYLSSVLSAKNIGIEPFLLLLGPSFYFYASTLTEDKSITFKRLIKHYIIFVGVMLFTIITTIKFIRINITLTSILINSVIIGQLGFYVHRIKNIIKVYEAKAHEEYSNLNNRSILWIHFMMRLFIIIMIATIIILPVNLHFQNILDYDLYFALALSLIVFIVGYKGLLQKDIFTRHHTDSGVHHDSSTSKEISNNTIDDYLKTHKSYLNSDLTLSDLANQLHMTRNDLSQTINQTYDMTFSTFINKYRVEEAKDLLQNPGHQHHTILTIAFDSGFSSKSTFNTAFKRFTGLTPSEYRKKETN